MLLFVPAGVFAYSVAARAGLLTSRVLTLSIGIGVLALALHDDGRVDSSVQRPAGLRQATIGVDVVTPYDGLPPAGV